MLGPTRQDLDLSTPGKAIFRRSVNGRDVSGQTAPEFRRALRECVAASAGRSPSRLPQ